MSTRRVHPFVTPFACLLSALAGVALALYFGNVTGMFDGEVGERGAPGNIMPYAEICPSPAYAWRQTTIVEKSLFGKYRDRQVVACVLR